MIYPCWGMSSLGIDRIVRKRNISTFLVGQKRAHDDQHLCACSCTRQSTCDYEISSASNSASVIAFIYPPCLYSQQSPNSNHHLRKLSKKHNRNKTLSSQTLRVLFKQLLIRVQTNSPRMPLSVQGYQGALYVNPADLTKLSPSRIQALEEPSSRRGGSFLPLFAYTYLEPGKETFLLWRAICLLRAIFP